MEGLYAHKRGHREASPEQLQGTFWGLSRVSIEVGSGYWFANRRLDATFGVGLGMAAILLCSLKLGAVGAQEDAAKPEFYTVKVKPIFDANCARCHGGMNHRGGLNMETRAGLLKGGHDGSVLDLKDPYNSLIIKLIRHEGPKDDPMPMPPTNPKFPTRTSPRSPNGSRPARSCRSGNVEIVLST